LWWWWWWWWYNIKMEIEYEIEENKKIQEDYMKWKKKE
jgi:hypothetical protein